MRGTREEIDFDDRRGWRAPDSFGVAVFKEHDDELPALLVLRMETTDANSHDGTIETVTLVLDTERACGLLVQLEHALGRAEVPTEVTMAYMNTGMTRLTEQAL